MRRTPGRPSTFGRSSGSTPAGRSETIASGHSGDGTKPRMSEAPHTSTATNAPKPSANATAMPWRRRRGRSASASSGRTASAGRSAKRTAASATAAPSPAVAPTVRHATAGPIGNATGSART